MSRKYEDSNDSTVSEMAIVDTFTKLIFAQEDSYSPGELSIIQALRLADANALLDSHRNMGSYLQSLGVSEMIHLVTRVREQLLSGGGVSPVKTLRPGTAGAARRAVS